MTRATTGLGQAEQPCLPEAGRVCPGGTWYDVRPDGRVVFRPNAPDSAVLAWRLAESTWDIATLTTLRKLGQTGSDLDSADRNALWWEAAALAGYGFVLGSLLTGN